jgi:hypothetical protein
MSYDLFFRRRSSAGIFSQGEFSNYFKRRKFYEMKGTRAWYSNENTGVYFGFDFNSRDSSARRDSSLLPIAFNLNYYRPHVFGLEAEPEVAAFVEQFDLTISDPQNQGMGDGAYSRDGFLRGWNAGNEFGYGAIFSQDPGQKVMTLPSKVIQKFWRWNLGVETRLQEIGVDAFVPTVYYFNGVGKVRTGIVWGDGIPILLPEVDIVVAPRDRLAPKPLLGSAKKDMVVFAWDELAGIIKQYPKVPGDPTCHQLYYEKTPPPIEKLFRSKQPPKELPKMIPFDEVLDEELVAKCMPGKQWR